MQSDRLLQTCLTCGQPSRGHTCPSVTVASREVKVDTLALAVARPPETQRLASAVGVEDRVVGKEGSSHTRYHTDAPKKERHD